MLYWYEIIYWDLLASRHPQICTYSSAFLLRKTDCIYASSFQVFTRVEQTFTGSKVAPSHLKFAFFNITSRDNIANFCKCRMLNRIRKRAEIIKMRRNPPRYLVHSEYLQESHGNCYYRYMWYTRFYRKNKQE